jgi:hypothetical protein
MGRSTFKQNVSQLVTNKITADAASRSVPAVPQSVVIGPVVKYLEKSYSEIRQEIDKGYGTKETMVHFEDCDYFSQREVIGFLEEDGYKVEITGSHHITISWSHPAHS